MIIVWFIIMNIFRYTREGRQLKKCEMELNINILNSIPNGWIQKVYVQRFDCDAIKILKL